jgi:hypothetical protein
VNRPRQRGLLGGYAEEVAAAMRRRRDLRRPRVRVRVNHGEAQVLEEGMPEADRLLAVARIMLDERDEPRDA